MIRSVNLGNHRPERETREPGNRGAEADQQKRSNRMGERNVRCASRHTCRSRAPIGPDTREWNRGVTAPPSLRPVAIGARRAPRRAPRARAPRQSQLQTNMAKVYRCPKFSKQTVCCARATHRLRRARRRTRVAARVLSGASRRQQLRTPLVADGSS